VIQVEDLCVSLGGVEVLEDVSLSVDRGELVGLIGPNGAGKTTLLRAVYGALEPDGGRVRLDGEPVAEMDSARASRLVATVPQDGHVGFEFSVEAVVEMGRTPHRSRLDWSEGGDAVEAALERTETASLRDRRVDEISGGERQRVLLARALAQETPALVLDEPTASLDINHQVAVLELVADLVADGRAVIAAIHDLDLAARYCDRLCLLGDGTVQSVGSPAAVLDDEELGETFDTTAAVTHNPITGTPTVAAVEGRPDRKCHVHVVGGGRTGARVVGALWRAGFTVSVGLLGDGDAAADVADRLGCRTVTAPPFDRPDDRRRAAERFAARADVLVDTGGPGSEEMRAACRRHPRVVDAPDAASRPRLTEAVLAARTGPSVSGDEHRKRET
jgi:iron complex transport system ATP-binding protein